MHPDPDPRADALARIAALEARLEALAAAAAGVRDELTAVGASIEAIPAAPVDARAEPPAPARTAWLGDASAAPAAAAPDLSGARIVALDLVLRGVPRDDAVLRLAADYPGVDVATLLDEAAAARG